MVDEKKWPLGHVGLICRDIMGMLGVLGVIAGFSVWLYKLVSPYLPAVPAFILTCAQIGQLGLIISFLIFFGGAFWLLYKNPRLLVEQEAATMSLLFAGASWMLFAGHAKNIMDQIWPQTLSDYIGNFAGISAVLFSFLFAFIFNTRSNWINFVMYSAITEMVKRAEGNDDLYRILDMIEPDLKSKLFRTLLCDVGTTAMLTDDEKKLAVEKYQLRDERMKKWEAELAERRSKSRPNEPAEPSSDSNA